MELFGIITKGLKIKNDPTFEPITDDFQIKWNKTLYSMEEKFAVILLYEKSNAAKLEIDLTKELLNGHLKGYKEKRFHLYTKHKCYENELEKRRLKKKKKNIM